ncbi:MAG: hypothetical protein Q9169_003250 [Polycauliona sp. 2 TL-2023]
MYHYYDQSSSLEPFMSYVQNKICSKQDSDCSRAAERLEKATYHDIDYDAESRNFVLTSLHHKSPNLEGWDEEIKPRWNSAKTEVGVFASRPPTEPQELSLDGHSTVIGEDERPKRTRFSFLSRHHPVPLTSGSGFSTTFPTPRGLHPTLRLTFPSPIVRPVQGCALHTYLTLPSSFFIDKYQLASPNFLVANNLRGIRALLGETDLEAPKWVVKKWGSIVLLEIAHREPNQVVGPKSTEPQWHVDVPLHARYLPPAAGGAASVDLPWPIVFWACPAEEETDLHGSPFDRVNLGYESLFGPATTFCHFRQQPQVEGGRRVEQVQVPVMDLQESGWVENWTIGVVLLGALWVMYKLLKFSFSRSRANKRSSTRQKVL